MTKTDFEQKTSTNENISFFENFYTNFVVAGASAAISKTLSAPIERVKLILQSEREIMRSLRANCTIEYKNVPQVLKNVYRNEGILAFWRGNTASVLRYFPTQGMNFALNEKFKSTLPRFSVSSDEKYSNVKKLSNAIFAGGMAGALSQAMFYTLDFTRTQLANDLLTKEIQTRKYNNLRDVYNQIYAREGIQGLHRGISVSIAKMFVYRGLYFGLYDFSKNKLRLEAPLAVLINSYCCTLTAVAIAYPLDTINKRLIMTSGSGYKYKGSADCIRQIVHKEGIKSLYRGFGVLAVRSIAGAGVLALYDLSKKMKFMQ